MPYPLRPLLAAALAILPSLALAAPPPKPLSRAEIETSIIDACIGEGGKAEECRCGLNIAKEGLTDRQFQIFPILWPIVKGKGDFASKFAAGSAALTQAGYNVGDGFALMMVLQANSGRVEKECKGQTAATAPAPVEPAPPAAKP